MKTHWARSLMSIFVIDALSIRSSGYAELWTRIKSGNLLYKHDNSLFRAFSSILVGIQIHVPSYIYTLYRYTNIITNNTTEPSRRNGTLGTLITWLSTSCDCDSVTMLTFSFDSKIWTASINNIPNFIFATLGYLTASAAKLCPIQFLMYNLFVVICFGDDPSASPSSKSLTAFCSFVSEICLLSVY